MSKTLEREKQKIEQQKAKIALKEARLKLRERKARTRRLIELGGLLAKVKLDSQPNNVLYGMLLEAKENIKEESQLKKWAKIGGAAFAAEQKNKTLLILKFSSAPPKEVLNNVRGHGLKWNGTRHEWHGYVEDLNQLKNDVSEYDCKVIEMEKDE
jgi:hypothetical protein